MSVKVVGKRSAECQEKWDKVIKQMDEEMKRDLNDLLKENHIRWWNRVPSEAWGKSLWECCDAIMEAGYLYEEFNLSKEEYMECPPYDFAGEILGYILDWQ